MKLRKSAEHIERDSCRNDQLLDVQNVGLLAKQRAAGRNR